MPIRRRGNPKAARLGSPPDYAASKRQTEISVSLAPSAGGRRYCEQTQAAERLTVFHTTLTRNQLTEIHTYR